MRPPPQLRFFVVEGRCQNRLAGSKRPLHFLTEAPIAGTPRTSSRTIGTHAWNVHAWEFLGLETRVMRASLDAHKSLQLCDRLSIMTESPPGRNVAQKMRILHNSYSPTHWHPFPDCPPTPSQPPQTATEPSRPAWSHPPRPRLRLKWPDCLLTVLMNSHHGTRRRPAGGRHAARQGAAGSLKFRVIQPPRNMPTRPLLPPTIELRTPQLTPPNVPDKPPRNWFRNA